MSAAQRTNNPLAKRSTKADPPQNLTAAEQTVLVHIANGQTYAQIASMLGITERRVRSYAEMLRRRLNINSTAGLTRYAIAHGLIEIRTS